MYKVISKDKAKQRIVEKPSSSTTAMAQQAPEISQIIVDSSTGKRYLRGKFLGKGGFAKCYELTDMDTKEIYAGKIVPKSMLMKPHQKEKMSMEISIHRSVAHKHIVGFHGFFEDSNFVYVILELCRRRSMMELHKRRKALTEPEVRYYMKQIVEACEYLHGKQKVIHRDLKLGNLFLNDDMEIKIGDFGLATKLDCDGERKKQFSHSFLAHEVINVQMKLLTGSTLIEVSTHASNHRTLCGTPNYIAPEVLSKKGHSYEVDVWSLGCIFYTLLVGKPPFETNSLKETYQRIKKNEYYIPSKVTHSAQMLIIKLLRPDPSSRPRMNQTPVANNTGGSYDMNNEKSCSELQKDGAFLFESDKVLDDDFFRAGYCPTRLPISCLTMAPRFPSFNESTTVVSGMPLRKPLSEVNARSDNRGLILSSIPEGKKADDKNMSRAVCVKDGIGHDIAEDPREENDNLEPEDCYLSELNAQLMMKCLNPKPAEFDWGTIQMDEAEDPASTPVFWISKWVDYSDKYGLGYQLNDGSVGVLFNDATRLIQNKDGATLQYIDRDGKETFYPAGGYPTQYHKKFKLLEYFTSYMNEHLLKAGADVMPRAGGDISRLPYLRIWLRTRSAIILHLSCGILQINFFQDHTKIIICPKMGAVTYIDEKRNFRTYKLSLLEQYGCSKELVSRLIYGKSMVQRLQESMDKQKKNRT